MEYELQHYGVLGMKWGIRRARRKNAKATYRKRTDKAFKEYEKTLSDIEKNYKRGQTLSKKDQDREAAAEKKYADAAAKAKADYKKARNDRSGDAKIANELYSKNSKEVNEIVANMSTGKAVAQSYLMGSYGALKYNDAKSKGYSTGIAAVAGLGSQMADSMFYNAISTAEYFDNVAARKK